MVTMGLLIDADGALMLLQEGFDMRQVGIAVRAVGQHYYAIGEARKHSVEGISGGAPVAEGCVSLRDLLHLGGCINRETLPVTGQSFEEMIALDVAVIVRARHIRRIQIDKV